MDRACSYVQICVLKVFSIQQKTKTKANSPMRISYIRHRNLDRAAEQS